MNIDKVIKEISGHNFTSLFVFPDAYSRFRSKPYMKVQHDEMELDIERLMHNIREAAARRKWSPRFELQAVAKSVSRRPLQSQLEKDLSDLKLTPEFKARTDDHYHVNDLLKFHDVQFVRSAYRAILKREADDQGFQGYLERLRSGNRNKIDVLASLRFSPEGRQRRVRIDGLMFPAAIRVIGRLPVLGYFVQLAIGVLRLPAATREQRRFESYAFVRQQQVVDYANRLARAIRELRALVKEVSAGVEEQQQLTTRLDQRQQDLANLLTQTQNQLREIREQHEQQFSLQEDKLLAHGHALADLSVQQAAQKTFAEELNSEIVQTKQNVSEHSHANQELAGVLKQVKRDVAAQQARTTSLMKAISENAAPGSRPSDLLREEDSHMLDGLYASLEDHFRGEPGELKKKFEVYLPYLTDAAISTDILDIGCGRGEWLELLRDKGLQASGIDANRVMSEHCRAAGLLVTCENAIDYLRSLADDSLAAVTAFHIVEHLEFKALAELIDEIVRTLRPGGLLILETPNPENIIVGSCNFYLDPTHHHALPIQTAKFLLEAKGLGDLKVLGLHPLESSRVQGDSELIDRFNEFFYGPMDYAIIARRD